MECKRYEQGEYLRKVFGAAFYKKVQKKEKFFAELFYKKGAYGHSECIGGSEQTQYRDMSAASIS